MGRLPTPSRSMAATARNQMGHATDRSHQSGGHSSFVPPVGHATPRVAPPRQQQPPSPMHMGMRASFGGGATPGSPEMYPRQMGGPPGAAQRGGGPSPTPSFVPPPFPGHRSGAASASVPAAGPPRHEPRRQASAAVPAGRPNGYGQPPMAEAWAAPVGRLGQPQYLGPSQTPFNSPPLPGREPAQQQGYGGGGNAGNRGSMSWAPPPLNGSQMPAANNRSWAPPMRDEQGPIQDLRPHEFPQCASMVVPQGGQGLAPCQSWLAPPPGQNGHMQGFAPCQTMIATPCQDGLPQCQSMLVPQGAQGLEQCQSMLIPQGAQGLAQCQSMLVTQGGAQGFAQCQSMVAPAADYMAWMQQQNGGPRAQAAESYGPLRFASASYSKQHPAKTNTGIPNADAILEGLDYLGVADGVSGVFHLGLPPEALPWELLRSCGKKLFSGASSPAELKRGKDSGTWLINLIQEAYDNTEAYGATTLLVAALRDQNLITACLGDSAMIVFRPSSLQPLQLRSIFKTEPGRYDARRPIQIQRLHGGGFSVAGAHQVIQGAMVSTTPVQPGDFLVLGSDGLFDNIGDADIGQVIERCCAQASGRSPKQDVSAVLELAAKQLVDLAISRVKLDRNPADVAAGEVPANNADDTTALVAMVQAEALPPQAQVVGELTYGMFQAGDRFSRDVYTAKKKKRGLLASTCGFGGGSSRGSPPTHDSMHRSKSVGSRPSDRKAEECVIS